MLKNMKNKLLIVISSLFVFSSVVASASFIIIKGYEHTLNSNISVSEKVAKNLTTNVEYYTLEEAFNEAYSGHTVVVHPGTNPVLLEDSVIKEGVTLALPLIKNDISETALNGNSEVAYFNGPEHSLRSVNNMVISPNTTLTIRGKLNIFGQLTAGGGGSDYTGGTNGDFSSITLANNSKIVVEGELICRGFIFEENPSSQSEVDVKGGKVTIPAIIRDYKGGSVLRGYEARTDEYHTLPFDQLNFPNIEPLLRLDYDSSLYGQINIYSGDRHNYTTQELISKRSESFISFLDEDCILEAKYDKNKDKSHLEFFGDVSMNNLKIKLQIDIIITVLDIEVNSNEYFFPFSWRLPITLSPFKDGRPSNVNMPYMVMMLPGSYLKINRNVTLNIDSDFTILDYQENKGENPKYYFNDTDYSGKCTKAFYCNEYFFKNSDKEATLINNGVVKAKNLAGRISSLSEGAVFEATGNKVTTYHLNSYEEATMNIKNDVWESVTNNLRGKKDSNNYVSLNAGKYISNSDLYWQSASSSDHVSFDKKVISIKENEQAKVNITSSGTYTLENTNEEVISVDNLGNITALKVGKSTLIARCNSAIDYCEVEVLSNDLLTFSSSSLSVKEGESVNVVATTNKNNATFTLEDKLNGNKASFNVSEPSFNDANDTYSYIITIKIPDLSIGQLKIKGVCGSASKEVVINVSSLNTITLDKSEEEVNVDNTLEVVATISGTSANRKYLWSTSNSEVASISPNSNKVTITGVSEGEATIKLTYGTASASMKVKVTSGSCVLGDTKILMSDGNYKLVKDIDPNDLVMTFNHTEGRFVSQEVLFNAHKDEKAQNVEVITLYFNNGEHIDIAYNHGFYNLTLNKYVTINKESVNNYIGHEFYYLNNKGIKLTDYSISNRMEKVYAPFIKEHFNCVTNGLISIPGVVSDFLMSVYEFNKDLIINKEQLDKNINLYGLFTYDELKEYVSYDIYKTLKLQYLKIGLGKNLYSFEDIIYKLSSYSKYF